LGDVRQAQQLVWASLSAPGAATTPPSSPSTTWRMSYVCCVIC